MKRLYPIIITFLALALAQTEPVTVKLEAYVVSTITKEDGTTEEQFSEAKEARPGQIVEYRVVVTNISDETLPASNAIITGPIPDTTTYIADSATPSSEGPDSSIQPMVVKLFLCLPL